MKAADFLNNVEKYIGRNLFLIAGTETYIADVCVEGVIHAFRLQNEAWNLRVFKEGASGEEIRAACLQAPSFSPIRVISLDNIDVSEEAFHFLDILKSLPEETKLIIKLYRKPDMRKNAYKALLDSAVVVDAEAPEGMALVKWVMSMAKKEDVSLSPAMAEKILAIAGEDMYTVKNEISKISFLSKPTEKDINAVLSATIEYDAFSFHSDMLAGRFERALETFDKLRIKKEEVIMFIGLLVSKFSPMYLARLCIDAGLSDQAAISELSGNAGIKNYPAKLAVRECKHFTKGQLEGALRLLGTIDQAVKTGEAFIGFRAVFFMMYGYGDLRK